MVPAQDNENERGNNNGKPGEGKPEHPPKPPHPVHPPHPNPPKIDKDKRFA